MGAASIARERLWGAIVRGAVFMLLKAFPREGRAFPRCRRRGRAGELERRRLCGGDCAASIVRGRT